VQYKQLYAKFVDLDTDKNTVLNLAEFRESPRRARPRGDARNLPLPSTAACARPPLAPVAAAEAYLKANGGELSDDDVKLLFSNADKSGDSNISASEFVAVHTEQIKYQRAQRDYLVSAILATASLVDADIAALKKEGKEKAEADAKAKLEEEKKAALAAVNAKFTPAAGAASTAAAATSDKKDEKKDDKKDDKKEEAAKPKTEADKKKAEEEAKAAATKANKEEQRKRVSRRDGRAAAGGALDAYPPPPPPPPPHHHHRPTRCYHCYRCYNCCRRCCLCRPCRRTPSRPRSLSFGARAA